MKLKFLGLCALVFCLGVTACTEPMLPFVEPSTEPTPETPPKEEETPEDIPLIDFSTGAAEVAFDEGETTKTITFQVNQSWTNSVLATKSDEITWLSVSPESGGAGLATLTITAAESYALEARTAYIHINIDGLSRSIAVTQTAGILKLADDGAAAPVAAGGFFVANENQFGKSNGTVNYFKQFGASYQPTYRAYRAANSGEELGVTTQFATIWGDNVYFCSKQGNRLVVADAKTLKKRAVLTTIGGDGRAFVGVDDQKGYIAHSAGVVTFDLATLQLGAPIAGVSGQIGTMCAANGRVFIVSQSNGLYVVDAQTDQLEQTIAGTYYTITRSKDGAVWVAEKEGLVRIDPETLAIETVPYPANGGIGSSWGAWNAGALCASTQHNTLYWSAGGGAYGGAKTVVQFDVETRAANTAFYALGTSESGTQLVFYGAGLRVDPLTDELILMVIPEYDYASNWAYKLNASGQETAKFQLKGGGSNLADNHYWFPAVPFFEDANKPQILINQILLAKNEEQTIDLAQIILDHDNTFASIQTTAQLAEGSGATCRLEGNKLTITAGDTPVKQAKLLIAVVSNGVRVEKTVQIDITE